MSEEMIKPGDIVEWVYERAGEPVLENEELWSTLTKSRCQIGSVLVNTCIACDGKTITWLNSKGLFHARIIDTPRLLRQSWDWKVVPRVKK